MSNVLVDAGPLIAFLDRTDRHHAAARKALAACKGHWLSTWPALTEAAYLAADGATRAHLIELLRLGAVVAVELDTAAIEAIAWYQAKYRDRNPDLADLSPLAASDSTGVRTVLTFDRDFSI